MLPKAAVLCALLTLVLAGSQGNKEANVDNYHLAAWKERVLRLVGQPTVFPKDSGTCSPYTIEYESRQDLLLCDEKYIRAVFNEIETSNCTNEYYNDTALFYGCGHNDDGDVCASIDDNIYYDFYYQCDRSSYTSKCSSKCRTMLRQLNESVGCCIHDDYVFRMPSLWRNCNIQQPEVCADTPNIAGILAKRNVDPCTEKCSRRQYYYIFCKYIGKEYEKTNRECGFEDIDVVYDCGFDKGEFCIEMDYRISYFKKAIPNECYSIHQKRGNVRDGVCSTKCRNVLEEYVDTVGCCFHYFNSSFFNQDPELYVSSALFSACGIKVPDACKSFNSRAVPNDYLECAGFTINNSGAALQSGVYSIGLIIIGLIATYIMYT